VNKEKLEAKGKKLDQDFRNRAQSLQNDINAYQRNVGTMTIGQAKAVEEDLGKKQQNLQLYQRSLEQEIMTDQAKMNEELYAKITAYLKQYGEEKGLQVVFKYDPSSDLLFGGKTIDITQDVIKGLNEAFKAESTKPATKADSTATKK
jgi:outer membrane protein